MPIHLFWGENCGASEEAIEKLIAKVIDPAWSTINLSRLDGADTNQAFQALDEIRTPPFGGGSRVILLKRSPFLNNCPNNLVKRFEETILVIPQMNYLILNNTNKPDGRLKTTKAIYKLIKKSEAKEHSFKLPQVWDTEGQKKFVLDSASDLNIYLEDDAVLDLVEAIGNDSSRLYSELKKLSLLAESQNKVEDIKNKKIIITSSIVKSLIGSITTNSLEVSNCLLEENIGEAIIKVNALLESGEPALRILATLTNQIRGWLWVKLLEKDEQKDVGFIAKNAGISNPKRIFIMRKQIKGKSTKMFLDLLSKLLDIEAALKRGKNPIDAFKESLLAKL